MKIGVMMHCTDRSIAPAELAVEAEARGFESMFVTEHTHIPVRPFIRWRGGEAMPEQYKRLHDPIVALATAAAVTSTILLGTGVLVLAQREPLATAKQLASLDRLLRNELPDLTLLNDTQSAGPETDQTIQIGHVAQTARNTVNEILALS